MRDCNVEGIFLTEKDVVKEEPISLFSKSSDENETIFLSNIDQALGFPVETLYFFEVPTGKSHSTLNVGQRVKEAVEVLLGPYYFMAGRLNFNEEAKRMELICNNAGVLFVSATSELTLKDLGNLSQPNPTFHHFVHRPGLYKSLPEKALFTIQVTRFSCGGFSIGFTMHHSINDGKSASDMLHNLASICRGEGLKVETINNDRTCIKARNPPQIKFPHSEYVKLQKTPNLPSSFTSQERTTPSPLVFSDKYVHKTFHFSPEMLNTLKKQAMTKCSTFDAIVAHIWKARTKAVLMKNDRISTVLFAVDIRSRISPPLPNDFSGNAVITAFASAKVSDLVEMPLSFGVEKMKEARERVTNEYIRSVIDWLEVYKGIPATCDGTFYVSAWWKLPFKELDFGFGKPVRGGPIASGNDEFVLLLSNNDDQKSNIGGNGNGGGIILWMALEKEAMFRFMSCVYDM
ncbi:OLC1v1020386C1 [Oldenlandia corymbosa var. corymbosa]|uniref:OLC1v1020386C1 n=1 Tax=Oldenlandia corymbosa var. corymbosa TaxID=529605 RepID=A0AAV1EG93_OLDCO|nr:OLC1v1020386C1 [Oldenlandia corymbosa var. corymbosa]